MKDTIFQNILQAQSIIEKEWPNKFEERFSKTALYNRTSHIILQIDKNHQYKYGYYSEAFNGKTSKKFRHIVFKSLVVFLKKEFKISFQQETETFLRNKKTNTPYHFDETKLKLNESGIVDFFTSFPISDIQLAIKKAKKRIIIIESCLFDIEDWLLASLEESIKRVSVIEIFILHPESEACSLRSRNLRDNTENKIRQSIVQNLWSFGHFNRGLNIPNIKIYLYDEMPTINAFIIDDIAWMGSYPYGISTTNFPYTKILALEKGKSSYLGSLIWNQLAGLKKKYKPNDLSQIGELVQRFNYISFLYDNTRLNHYCGTYKIYYNLEFSKERHLRKSRFIKNIGVNILKIYKEVGSNYLKVKLKVFSNKLPIETYYGTINPVNIPISYINLKLKGKPSKKVIDYPNTLPIDLTNDESYVQLLIKTNGNKPHSNRSFFGSFSIIYNDIQEIGLGSMVMVKTNESYNTISPTSIDPLNATIEIDLKTITYLTHKNTSTLHPVSSPKELPDNFQYHGSFHVFNANKKEGLRYISIGALKIHSNRYAEHRLPRNDREEYSEGYAKKIGKVLHIILRNSEHPIVGYFIIEINDNPPLKNTIYTGIYLGQSYRDGKVISNRVLLKYIGNAELKDAQIKKVRRDSKEYKDIPYAIRHSLSGRLRNTIGFFRQKTILSLKDLEKDAKKEWSIGKLLLESAFTKIVNEEFVEARNMIRRAKEYYVSPQDFNHFKKLLHKDFIPKSVQKKVCNWKIYKYLDSRILE